MEYKRYGKNEDLYRSDPMDEEPILKVILEGTYKGRRFVIGAHHGGFPDAYLEVQENDYIFVESKKYEGYDGNLCKVHGGSTYFGKAYWDEEDNRTYVGWDYSHLGDFSARWPNFGGTRYTLIDILMDVAVAETEIEYSNDEDEDYFNRLYGKKQ